MSEIRKVIETVQRSFFFMGPSAILFEVQKRILNIVLV